MTLVATYWILKIPSCNQDSPFASSQVKLAHTSTFCLGKRPTGIRNLILNENYTINGCPPAVTPALQNFTVSALLCGEPEPSDNGKTTIPPGGNSPLDEEEVENVYIFSTEKNNKVEWKIDTSATSMPVYGAHEFIRYVVIKISQNTIDCTY